MTTPNRFAFDIVGNDKASDKVDKVLGSINKLIPALQQANAQFTAIQSTIQSIGTVNFGGLAKAQVQAAENQRRNSKRATDDAQREEAANERRAQKILNTYRQEEAAYQRKIDTQHKNEAAEARAAALAEGSAQRRAQLLSEEMARTKAIADIERQRFMEAKAYASETGLTARTTPASDPRKVAYMQESVYAAKQLGDQERRVASAEREVAAATKLHEVAVLELDKINKQAALNQAFYEENLSRTRYALFQIGYAYQQIANVAGRSLAATASAAISHQAALAQVARTTNLGQTINEGGDAARGARTELAAMDAQLMQLSRDIPVAFGDLSSITALGAQLGIQKENLIDFTEVVAQFSATTDVSTEQAAKSFGQLQNILNVPSAQFRNLGSAVSELGTSSVATESDILAVATQIGAVANNAKFSAPYVLGLSTALASVRVPPELARGTTTRLFQEIARAAINGGDKLDLYANVLHRTADETADLWKSNPEQFFNEFITSLGRTVEAGDSLIPILDGLGIKGSRDVPVITRLANAYQLLNQYVGQSAQSFSAGTYLEKSFQITADTVKASLQELKNSFQNFLSTVGGPFLAPIQLLAEGLTKVFEALSHLPAPLTSLVAGIGGLIGIMFAYRAAVSIATAAMFAMRVASEGLTNADRVRQPTVSILIQELKRRYAETLANTTADRLATTASAQRTAAERAAIGSTVALTAEQRALTVSSTGAVVGLNGIAAAEGRVAAGGAVAATGLARVGAAIKAIPFVGWVAAIASLAIGFWDSFSHLGDGVDEAAAKQRELNAEFLTLGTGADGLKKAIDADTKAFAESGNVATKANGVYETFTRKVEVAADGTKNLVGYVTDLNANTTEQVNSIRVGTTAMDAFDSTIQSLGGSQNELANQVSTTTQELETQTTAIGKFTDEWRRNNFLEELKKTFNTPDLQKALNSLDLGALNTAITAGLEKGQDGVKASVRTYAQTIQTELTKLQREMTGWERNRALAGMGGDSQGFNLDVGGTKPTAEAKAAGEARIKLLQDQLTVLRQIGITAQTSKATIDQQISENSAFTTLAKALGVDIDTLKDLDEEADQAREAIEMALDAFNNLMTEVTRPLDLQSGLLDSLSKLGESIGQNGADFSVFTDAGRENLSALEDAINAYSDIQQNAIQTQGLSAEQAAANMQAYVADLLNQLSAMGIDTSPLDILETRLADITGIPHAVIVNADVTGALSGIAAVGQALNTLPIASSYADLFSVPIPGAAAPAYNGNVTSVQKNLMGSVNSQISAQTIAASRAKAIAEAAEKANKSAKSAADSTNDALQKQKQYIDDLAGAYKGMGTVIMGSIKAEGSTFQSLQQLGQALAENGKHFDTITENGRKNFDALTGVFDAFGSTLSASIQQGALTAQQAQAKYKEFAQGVYGELVQLGVPTETLSGLFRGLGVSAAGWTGNSGQVQQYAGFITAAAEAMKSMTDETARAEEYADKLGDALRKAFDRRYGLENAVDAVQSAINGLRDAYQESIDKAEELRIANEKLGADLGGAQVDKRKAEIEQAISVRYGETDRAQDYAVQAADAQARIDDINAQLAANAKERDALEKGRNSLDGYSAAAIENRKNLQDLQSQMLDQIRAYAASGATTEKVTALTDKLGGQFVDAAKEAGYTEDQVKRYTDTFRLYSDVIRALPSRTSVDVSADTSAAMSALNAIPRWIDSRTYAAVDPNSYFFVKNALNELIPKPSDYVIRPSVDPGALASAQGALSGLGSGVLSGLGGMTSALATAITKFTTALTAPFSGNYSILFPGAPNHWAGGPIDGYPFGGSVGGPAPRNPFKDNLLARGPDGSPIGLQGGEFVVRRLAVQQYGLDFLSAINSGRLGQGYAAGSANNSTGTMMVELSPQDRALLDRLPDRMPRPALYVDSRKLAEATSRGNVKLTGRGSN